MPKPPVSPLFRYGVVCLAVALAMLLRWPFPLLGPNLPFLLLWPIILLSAWYYGLGAGLLAALLSVLGAAYFMSASDEEVLGLEVYAIAALAGSLVVPWLGRSQRRQGYQDEWLRVTQSSIGDAVIATDIRARITFFNPAASRLTGWDQEEAIGKLLDTVFRVVNEQTRNPIESPVIKALMEDATVNLPQNTLLLAKDGTERPIEDSASPIRDDGGAVIGAVLIFHDISQRRRMETELREKGEKLAQVDRSGEEFLAKLAHELHTPVNPLLQGLENLPSGGEDPQAIEQTRQVLERQFRHLTQVVDDLLDVVLLTRDKSQLRRERLDLAELVRKAAEERREALQHIGVILALELPTTPVWMSGDPLRLKQALTLLLESEPRIAGGPVPLLVLLAVNAGERQALLSIMHGGLEVPPERLPRLFDVFARSNNNSVQDHGRPGLGLPLAKELVELHGGDVRATSEGSGRGIKFLVRLPLEEEPLAVAETPTGSHPSAIRLRILVVEDNEESAESLYALLHMLGHEVAVVCNGPEALAKTGDWRPNIIFSDIGLPGMSGYELARELRRNPAAAKIPLIAITGYGDDEDRRRSREAGFDHHLVKPVEPTVLQSVLALQVLLPHNAEAAVSRKEG
jgi:PAS domain S-box-containing protein